MRKFNWHFGITRKNTSLAFFAVSTGLVLLTSAFYYMDWYKSQRLTLNSNAQVPATMEQYCRNGVYYAKSQKDGSEIKCGRAPHCGGYSYSQAESLDYLKNGTCWLHRELGVDACSTTCKGYVPLCCYAMEQTGNIEACVWTERKYCHPTQCQKHGITQNCGDAIGHYCRQDGCVTSSSQIPYVPLDQRVNGGATLPSPTPTFNPSGSINCPTTSTNTYAAGTIKSAEASGDRAPADFHPDKNWALRGYLLNDNNTKQLVNNNDPTPDALAPQFTTMMDNPTPAIYHTYQVYDWNWGTAPNWGSKGAPLINWQVTAAGFYGNPGDKLYVPRSGREIAPGYEAFVTYASRNAITGLGTITMLYLADDNVKGGYAIQYDNFCVDPNLYALYQQLSPPNATNRTQLPRLKKGDTVGVMKTREVVVAIKDIGEYMDPRSIAWWNGVTQLPTPPDSPTQCPVPSATTGMQYVRNGDNTTITWNPNSTATRYSIWVDNKRDPWDGSCSSASGDFCLDTTATSHTFKANLNDSYEWKVHAFNACGQVYVTGSFIPNEAVIPTSTPTPTLLPACQPLAQPPGNTLVWSCEIGSFAKGKVTWGAIPNATSYTLEIDNLSDPWDGSCASPGGDLCVDLPGTSYNFDMNIGDTYAWSVRAKTSCTASSKSVGATFRCALPTGIYTPTPIPPTGAPTAVPTSMNPPTNTPSPTPTPSVTPTPEPRHADCNKCGYCSNQTKQPQNYLDCMACLYPGMTEKQSLFVDPLTNEQTPPAKGKYYSQLGCIDVGAGGFRDPSAAGGLLNVILNRLLFPITGVLALLALIYGSFLLITGQDDPEQIARGKSWIYGGIIGVVFTFSAIFIIRLIASDILKIPGFTM